MRNLTLEDIPKLITPDGYVYLGSPYSKYPDGTDQACRAICLIAAELVKRRVRIWCPIAHSHAIATQGGLDALDHTIWMYQDEGFEPNATALVIAKMKTWDMSYGLSVERANFEAAGKPVWGLDPKLLGILGA